MHAHTHMHGRTHTTRAHTHTHTHTHTRTHTHHTHKLMRARAHTHTPSRDRQPKETITGNKLSFCCLFISSIAFANKLITVRLVNLMELCSENLQIVCFGLFVCFSLRKRLWLVLVHMTVSYWPYSHASSSFLLFPVPQPQFPNPVSLSQIVHEDPVQLRQCQLMPGCYGSCTYAT